MSKAGQGLELADARLSTSYRFVLPAANEAQVLRHTESGWQTVATIPVDKRYPHSLTVLFPNQTITFYLDGQFVTELAKPDDAELQTSFTTAGRGVTYLHHYGLYYPVPGETQTLFPASLDDKTYADEAASDLNTCFDSAAFKMLWLEQSPTLVPETSSWQRYESDLFGYAFSYPPGWTISSLDSAEDDFAMGFAGIDATNSARVSLFAVFVAHDFSFDDLMTITNEAPSDLTEVRCTLADPSLGKLLRVVSDARHTRATFAALSGAENERLAVFHTVQAPDTQFIDTLTGVYATIYKDMND